MQWYRRCTISGIWSHMIWGPISKTWGTMGTGVRLHVLLGLRVKFHAVVEDPFQASISHREIPYQTEKDCEDRAPLPHSYHIDASWLAADLHKEGGRSALEVRHVIRLQRLCMQNTPLAFAGCGWRGEACPAYGVCLHCPTWHS